LCETTQLAVLNWVQKNAWIDMTTVYDSLGLVQVVLYNSII